MKTCSVCKVEKLESCYDWKLGKLRANCKECVSKYTRQHYLQNKEYYHEKAVRNTKIARVRLLNFLFKYYQTHPCVDCGESDPVVLEFDHLREKTHGISVMIHRVFSLQKITNEIAKCEVVCSNCHKRRTAKRFNWYKTIRS